MLAHDWVDRTEYPFTSKWVELHDGRLHYVDEGSGPPALFVHGTPTWSFEYRHVIRAAMTSSRCIAPDHLGFGLSDRPRQASYTPEAHGRRLREFVDALGLDRFALVVHDYGGPIGLPLALAGRVTRLVLMNTWMWPFDDDKEMRNRAKVVQGALGRWMYRHLNASLKMLMPSAYAVKSRLTRNIHRQYLEPFRDREDRVRVLWPLASALLGSSPFYRDLYAQIGALRAIPTTIIWGLKDTAFRPHQLERWREELPQASILALDNAGHWPHEEAPSEVAEAIAEFLAAL
ncbi:MAG TPA: alpha/beta fold hydrolase [Gemmatimonadaceae bacterium]